LKWNSSLLVDAPIRTKLMLFPESMKGTVLCDLNSSSSQYAASDKIYSWKRSRISEGKLYPCWVYSRCDL